MAIIADAFAAGDITIDHVELLRGVDNERVHLQMIDCQDMFVGWLTTVVFRDLKNLFDAWLLGAEEREACKRRSVRQRQLHALLNLTGRGAVRSDGTTARPRVHIVMSQKVYEETLAWLEDPAANALPIIDRTDVDSKCQLIADTPVHRLYGIAASLTAKFRHTVYSARGRPIHDSYDTRSIPDWMRDIALITSNGKCSNPICVAPFAWLHGDHITPYSRTRDTSVVNTRPACEGDNNWRGNDTSRGHWGHDQPPSVDQRAEDYRIEQEELALARSRVRTLVTQSAAS